MFALCVYVCVFIYALILVHISDTVVHLVAVVIGLCKHLASGITLLIPTDQMFAESWIKGVRRAL